MSQNQEELLKQLTPRRAKIYNYIVNKKWHKDRIAEKLSIKKETISRELYAIRKSGIEIPGMKEVRQYKKRSTLPTLEVIPGSPYKKQLEAAMPQQAPNENSDRAIVLIGGSEALAKILSNLKL